MTATFRRDHLLNYLRLIAQDLVTRGVVRHQAGQSLDTLVSAEARAVTNELTKDLAEVLFELSGKMALGAGVVAEKRSDPAGLLVAGALRALGQFLLDKKKS